MNASAEFLPDALKTIAALAVVLGALWAARAVARRWLRMVSAPNGERMVRVLAAHPLGVKKSVMLLEVPGSVLVLGVTAERIQLLNRIRDPRLIERIAQREPKPAAGFPAQLSELLARIKGGGHGA
jgi:flagellar biosynthetic protein FliO